MPFSQETSNISVGSDSLLRNLVSSDSAFHKESNKLKVLDFQTSLLLSLLSAPFPPISPLVSTFLGYFDSLMIAYGFWSHYYFCYILITLALLSPSLVNVM